MMISVLARTFLKSRKGGVNFNNKQFLTCIEQWAVGSMDITRSFHQITGKSQCSPPPYQTLPGLPLIGETLRYLTTKYNGSSLLASHSLT